MKVDVFFVTMLLWQATVSTFISGRCPDGSSRRSCNWSPCRLAFCPAYPHATCVDNFCGGCTADFYLKGELVLDCWDVSAVCPDGSPRVDCAVSPCQVATCQTYPAASCLDNRCGGCNADWYVKGELVDCGAPDGWHLVDCPISPCQLETCPAYPCATCVDNVCGGCSADWYVNGEVVDCGDPCVLGCDIPNCPDGYILDRDQRFDCCPRCTRA